MPKSERLAEIVKNFGCKRVAVIGDPMVDLYYTLGPSGRVNPEEASADLYKVVEKHTLLGGAANAAANLAALGANVDLYGCVGDDAFGMWLKKECTRLRINPNLIYERYPTTVKLREILDGKQDRRLDDEKPGHLASERVQELTDRIFSRDYEGIVLSDYNKLIFRTHLGQKIIERARKNGVPTFVDPKPANAACFAGATLIRPNRKESIELVGEDLPPLALVRRLNQELRSDYTVATLGSEGMVAYDGNERGDVICVPAMSKAPINFVGAGDTVLAGLSLSLLSGANLEEAVWIASYAAGVVVEKPGTATLTRNELLTRINFHETFK